MSEYALAWELSRQRFDDTVAGLSHEQLIWRIHPTALSIGAMSIHLAGVEVSFASQLSGVHLEGRALRLKAAATDGVVNDLEFPFADEEITPELVKDCLKYARDMANSLIHNPSPAIRSKEIKSALGPMITGEGACARLAIHPAYHQGQAYLIRQSPEFPK
jgi:uncharacterized protein DUF664